MNISEAEKAKSRIENGCGDALVAFDGGDDPSIVYGGGYKRPKPSDPGTVVCLVKAKLGPKANGLDCIAVNSETTCPRGKLLL
jgi:hypothetical protein